MPHGPMADPGRSVSFADRAGYQAAVGELLGHVVERLDIFDIDLTDTGLSGSVRVAQLSDALSRDPAMRVRIALHDASALQIRMPRLWNLCAAQSHRMEIRETPRTLGHLTETFMLGAGGNALIRTHCKHWRGKLLLGDPAGEARFRQRFSGLWEACSCCISTTKFGL